jgi:hypothetical protein
LKSRLVINALAIGTLFAGMCLAAPSKEPTATGDELAVLQTDRAFVEAAIRDDKTTLATLADSDFAWTDAEGKTQSRAEILKSVPKPALGDESGARVEQRTYGQVGAVMSSRGKVHVLRIWVKRAAGWRVLVYHEVALSPQSATASAPGVSDCQNPCKTLPFKPKSEAEQAIIASWQALETGVANHDAAAWAPHIADDFVMLSTANDHPMSKSDRMATLNLQKQTGRGSAPAPLVSAHMFDFGDAVVMTCLHEPYTGKPVHVSRLWIKQDGHWIMSISYQTTIQAAPAKVS